jgi:phage recombination protein Bet
MNTDKKELQVSDQEKQHRAMMQIVRNTIFKNSTDEELALFFHICKSNNCSPLDRLLHPSVYKDSDGNRILVVVTSIDLMRSRSVETGLDNGMDEPEFSESIFDLKTEKETIKVPEWCKVRVYKKNVERPYVGVARWVEFYPGEKRGHMWRKMPTIMLAKCAEAQARRLAFPRELNKLYEEAEIIQATAILAGVTDSTQPPASGKPETTAPSEVQKPDEPTRKANKWISEGQEKRLYAILKANNVDVADFRAWLIMMLKKEHMYMISWAGKEYDKIIEHIEKNPKDFTGYADKLAAQETSKAAESTGKSEFQLSIEGYASLLGKTLHDMEEIINAEFGYIGLAEVPEDQKDAVLDHFKTMLQAKDKK